MTPLRQRMIDDMTVRGLAENTKLSYLRSVNGLANHFRRRPDRISAQEVQDYLLFLHRERGLAWQSCNTIRHGVRFLYRITLARPDPHFYVPGAKEPSTLPQILNQEELVRLFTVTANPKHRALLMTAYAAGLRASELCRLRVTDIDSQRMCLRVDRGKGNKDRDVPLSPRPAGATARVLAPRTAQALAVPRSIFRPTDEPLGGPRISTNAPRTRPASARSEGSIRFAIAMPRGCSRPVWNWP